MGRLDRSQRVLGAAWVVAAALLTVALAPHLGLRGWVWLLAHHLFLALVIGLEFVRRRRSR